MIRFLNGGRSFLLLLIITLAGGVFFGGCVNHEPDSDSLFNQNRPPVANAGPDQTVPSGARVQLEGTGSDPDGNEIRYEWRMVQTPEGSSAQLDTPASPTVGFVADTDGVYRIALQVVEEVDQNIPEGAPIENTGATSEPDEVMVIAGDPGAFENAGNKLILDGSHFALSTTVLDIGDPLQIGANTQLNEMTAEGWFFAGALPAGGTEALLMRKSDFFEIVLTSNADLLLRITMLDRTTRVEQTVTLGPAPFSIGQWHHIAAVIAGRSQHRAYLAVDGTTVAAADLTGLLLNNNSNRLTIGGGADKAFLVGMADEIRITQDVRYPEGGFDPPVERLIQDSPFVPGARFAVHGLWHFDEFAGAELFTDFSLRRNDLFLVGEVGFQPFGRLDFPRRFHTITPLADGSLLIAGGIDDGARTVSETEQIRDDDQLDNLAPLNIVKVTNENTGQTGDGSKTLFEFSTTLAPIVSDTGSDPSPDETGDDRRVVITAGNLTATDNGLGGWTGDAESGTIDYETGAISLTFATPPANQTPLVANYFYNRGTGVFYHTATRLDDGQVLIAGGADKDEDLIDRALLFDPAIDNSVVETTEMEDPRRFHTAQLLSDGRVLLVGGETDLSDGTIETLRRTEFYNPATLAFTPGPLLVQRRKLHRTILFRECNQNAQDDRFLVVGGYDETNRPIKTAEIYSGGANGGFFLTGSMSVERVRQALVCLPDGKILVTGGIDASGRVLDSAEIYDPVTGLFTLLQAGMNSARAEHTATPLPDGKILIAAGFDQSGQGLASAEIYDPDQNLFTPLSDSLGLARFGHVALPWTESALGKEGVLLIGGGDASGLPTALIEIFFP
ncbi:kelch repeat-containing protein [Candidatus Manganitrophus noduliformans]|uniref:Uncharacterized protein n=1 Tax=Candidatus Manganitrophus noduliformans TaxID=2606439 RepID=A0A7X6IAT5_9BACT|nr:kelch repeat-containing protein [Candidatus Manganitrophus noduliformans]NKE70898.1 hypothetical protein [Candidatus Manganitrophus noduliformans]